MACAYCTVYFFPQYSPWNCSPWQSLHFSRLMPYWSGRNHRAHFPKLNMFNKCGLFHIYFLLEVAEIVFHSDWLTTHLLLLLLWLLTSGLGRRGKLIVVGASPDNIPVAPHQIIGKCKSIVGHASGTNRDSQVCAEEGLLFLFRVFFCM